MNIAAGVSFLADKSSASFRAKREKYPRVYIYIYIIYTYIYIGCSGNYEENMAIVVKVCRVIIERIV